MKKLFFILIICITTSPSFAQSKEQFDPWFYGISLDGTIKDIFTRLNADTRIQLITKKDFADPDLCHSGCMMFQGKFINPAFMGSYIPDSSTIFLNPGNMKTVSLKRYSGNIKMIEVEYFFSDASKIDELFKLAVEQFKNGTKRKGRVDFNSTAPGKSGEGLQVIYIASPTELSKVEILKQTSSKGIRSLSVKYIASVE